MSRTHDGVEYPDWEPSWRYDRREGAMWLPSFGLPVTSYAHVESDNGFDRNETLFHIPNASIKYATDRSRNFDDGLTQRHPWARDEEADLIHLLDFKIDFMMLVSAWENTLTFRGLLTEAQAWDPRTEDPITGAEYVKEDPEGEEPDWYANAKFPYSPPRILFGDRPLKVRIDFQFGKSLNKWWRKNSGE